MTKSQEAAMDYIDNAIYEGALTISWKDIKAAVENAPVRNPKNWMRIRDVVADFKYDGSLVRTADVRVEEYAVGIQAWLERTADLESMEAAEARVSND
jgi:hypothetical protein